MKKTESMNSRELCTLVIEAIEELKGQNIVELDVRSLTDMTDYMIIASGRSRRQVIAIAEKVVADAKQANAPAHGTEGEKAGDWVLVDLVDVVVHIMEPEIRDYYQLEKLWGGHERSSTPHYNKSNGLVTD